MTMTSDYVDQIAEAPFEGYALTQGEYLATVAKVAKIQERAAKRGFTGSLRVEMVQETVESWDEVTGLTTERQVYRTKVVGTAPSYAGWTFLARIDRIPGTDQFTTAAAPGVEGIDRTHLVPGVCDHCGHDRRRNNTYVVVNQDGEQKQVGSTCIKDFLGWDAQVVFFDAKGASEMVEVGSGTRDWTFSTKTVLTYAYAAIRAFGWVPSSFEGQTTANVVRLGLGTYRPTEYDRKNVLPRLREFAAEAEGAAEAVLAFVNSDEFNGTSDYVANLKAACGAEYIGPRQVGLVASAPQAYIRHNEQQAERTAKAATAKASEFIGQVGDKGVEVTGTVQAIRYIEGDFGTTTLYTIVTAEGNLVKWFASRSALGRNEGVKVHLKGAIKKHDDFRGVKSTVLTNCRTAEVL